MPVRKGIGDVLGESEKLHPGPDCILDIFPFGAGGVVTAVGVSM